MKKNTKENKKALKFLLAMSFFICGIVVLYVVLMYGVYGAFEDGKTTILLELDDNYTLEEIKISSGAVCTYSNFTIVKGARYLLNQSNCMVEMVK
jgi:hypothetical protein